MIWASILIVVLVSCVFFYNQLAKLDSLAATAWQDLFIHFERRAELINQLPDEHFRKSIDELCRQARQQSAVKERQFAENKLGNELKRYWQDAENDGRLKNNLELRQLKQKFAAAEEDLQNARRHYNAAVRDYNVALHTVPTCWIAHSTKAEEKIFFKTGDLETDK